MKAKKKTLTEAELEIMKVIWSLDEATVRQVYEALLPRQGTAYTTVSTMMGILETKGYLAKEPQGRAYLYRPTKPQSLVVGGLVDDFLSRVFNGSTRPLLLSLVQRQKVSPEEWHEIQRMIEDDEETAP